MIVQEHVSMLSRICYHGFNMCQNSVNVQVDSVCIWPNVSFTCVRSCGT